MPEDGRLHVHSYHISGLLDVPVGRRLTLSSEFGFIQRGAACEPGFVGFDQDAELRLQYGQLSVNLGYDVLNWRRLTLRVYAGVGGSYLFSGHRTQRDDWSGNEVRGFLDLKDDDRYRRTDAGANFGVQARLRVGCGDLILRGGGYRGFRHVDSENFSLSRDYLLSVGYAQSF